MSLVVLGIRVVKHLSAGELPAKVRFTSALYLLDLSNAFSTGADRDSGQAKSGFHQLQQAGSVVAGSNQKGAYAFHSKKSSRYLGRQPY